MFITYINNTPIHIVSKSTIFSSGLVNYVLLKQYLMSKEKRPLKEVLTLKDFKSKKHYKRAWSRFKRQVLHKKGLNNICYLCGTTLTKENLSYDHLIPVSKGGTAFNFDNIKPCCKHCNFKKGNNFSCQV